MNNAERTPAEAVWPRVALSIREAHEAVGVGRTTIYRLIASGELRARKCGRRTVILREDLLRFLDALPSARGEGRADGG